MPLVATAAGRLFVAQRGAAPPALLGIHGAGGAHQHWGHQLHALSTAGASQQTPAHVVLCDLPGHGRSEPPGCTTIADYSAAVLALLDALELEQAILAGHSMGGAIALWTALHEPQRVAGLVLASTGAKLRIAPALLEALEQRPPEGVQMVTEWVYGPRALPKMRRAGSAAFFQVDPRVFLADLHACDVFDVREQLGAIACPTLVLCGAEDQMTPPRFSQFLQQHIPAAELALIPDAGHMLMIEQPAATSQAIAAWFTSRYRNG